MNMNLKKNDIINLKIISATAEGNGVGKTEDGIAVFVPLSAIGDELEVKILKTKKTYAFGKIEKIITPSQSRIETDCPQFSKCGGCVWRHISYEEELKIKSMRVYDSVTRIGNITNAEFRPIIASDSIERYRNKAQFPAGVNKENEPVFGFYSFHSHRIIECEDCLLQPENFTQVIEVTKQFLKQTDNDVYNELTGKGKLRHLYMRLAEVTGELMVCYVVNGNGLRQEDLLIKMLREALPDLKSVIINSNRERTNVILGKKNRTAYGADYISDYLCGLKFKISPFSFWQVNRKQAEKLYGKAKEYANLESDEILLDLYCGTGTIGLTMADSCKEVIGVEIIEDAIRDAKENAINNNIENARFICGDASLAAENLKNEGLKPDVIILDPPRKGCNAELISTIFEMLPKRIVYVSCDPATLARDLQLLQQGGYITKEITPCDMFSRTAHVETVVLLSRKDVSERIRFDVNVEDLQGRASATATYSEIKEYILDKFGLKVSTLYIAQIKDKCGLAKRDNYNKGNGKSKDLICPPEKEKAIMEAFKHFGMIK